MKPNPELVPVVIPLESTVMDAKSFMIEEKQHSVFVPFVLSTWRHILKRAKSLFEIWTDHKRGLVHASVAWEQNTCVGLNFSISSNSL